MRPVLLALAVVVVAARPAAAGSVPYADPAVVGTLTLCDRGGNAIDHGGMHDAPFVWAAVSSQPAPAPYDAAGRTATLFAYQPRHGVVPGQWSGELLTASTRYTDITHPTAAATAGDEPLATFVGDFPPSWDGLVELRLILGVPGEAARTQQYAATDIQVSGDSWRVLRGGGGSCSPAGQATSIENLLPVASTATPAPQAAAHPTTTVARPRVTMLQAAPAGDFRPTSSSGSHRAMVRAVVVLLTVALCAAWVVYARRRSERRGQQGAT